MQKFLTFDPTTHEVFGEIKCTKWNAPRNAIQVERLLEKEGFAVVVNEALTECKYVTDFRGKTIYNTADNTESEVVSTLGEIKAGWTLDEPRAESDTWVDGVWLSNKQPQAQKKAAKARRLYSSVTSGLKKIIR